MHCVCSLQSVLSALVTNFDGLHSQNDPVYYIVLAAVYTLRSDPICYTVLNHCLHCISHSLLYRTNRRPHRALPTSAKFKRARIHNKRTRWGPALGARCHFSVPFLRSDVQYRFSVPFSVVIASTFVVRVLVYWCVLGIA